MLVTKNACFFVQVCQSKDDFISVQITEYGRAVSNAESTSKVQKIARYGNNGMFRSCQVVFGFARLPFSR